MDLMPPQYASFGDPDLRPNAANPNLLPQFDPVVANGDGGVSSISPLAFLVAFPRNAAMGTVTLTGSITAGETCVIKLDNPILPKQGVAIATLAIAGDTLTTVAYRLIDLINSNPILKAFGITASFSVVSTNPVVTVKWPGPLGNFTVMTCTSGAYSTAGAFGGTVVTGDTLALSFPIGSAAPASAVTKLGGSATSGDVVTMTFKSQALTNGSASVSYAVTGGNTLTDIAAGLVTAINASTALDVIGMTSNATLNRIYTLWNSAFADVAITFSASRAATETIAIVVDDGANPGYLAPAPLPSVLVTIGGTVTTGDRVTLFFNASGANSPSGPIPVTYTALGGDTTALIAAGLAALINASTAFNGLFTAVEDGSDIAITWPGQAGAVSITGSAVGPFTESALTVVSPSTVRISNTSAGGNTTTDLAAAFKNAINANVILQALGMVASNSTSTLTVKWNGALLPFVIAKSVNGVETATVGGTVTAGDVLTITATDASLPGGAVTFSYTTVAGDTTTTIAVAFKNLINASIAAANAGITASNSGAVLSIASTSATQTTYSRTLSTGATETITLANTALETIALTITVPAQTITIGGSATADDTLNLTVTEPTIPGGAADVQYTVLSGDTTTTMAAGLANAINMEELLVDAGITATSNGAVITVVSGIEDKTPTLVAWANGAAKTITLAGTMATGNTVNVKFVNADLGGGAYTFQYAVQSTDTTATLLAASIAAAINLDTTLNAIGVTATSLGAVVSLHWPVDIGAMTITTLVNGKETATVGGTPTAADVITITVTDASLVGSPLDIPYTVTSGDTTNALLATHIAAALTASAPLVAAGITASALAAVVTIVSTSKTATTYARTLSGGATSTLTLAAVAGPTSTAAGGPTETFSISSPSDGTEVLTPTSPLAGGSGPVIPLSCFTVSSPDAQGGGVSCCQNFKTGTPAEVGYNMLQQMVEQKLPVI